MCLKFGFFMPKEIKYKDPNMYHEGVLIYRETFGLTPNKGFRSDIAVTVKTYDDLLIWSQLVTNWGYMKDGKWKPRNPLDVKGMITVFEMKQRQRDELREKAISARSRQSIPARPMGRVPEPLVPVLPKRSNGFKG